MSHVFKDQTLLTLTLGTGYSAADLATATVKRILWKDPNFKTGYFVATNSGTTLVYPLQAGDINKAGIWEFQAFVTIGGLDGFGEIAEHRFKQPLK